MLRDFINILRDSNELSRYYSLQKANKSASLAIVSSVRPLFCACDFLLFKKSMFVVVAGEKNARAFANELKIYLGPDKIFEINLLENEDSAKDVGKVIEAMDIARFARSGIVVCSARALNNKICLSKKDFISNLKIKKGTEIDLSIFETNLTNMGYERLDSIDGPGTFSVKGGNVDIFPSQLNYPVRIELFGDEVDDIRKIMPFSGQTIMSLDAVNIIAAKFKDSESSKPIFNLIHKNVVVYLDEPAAIIDDLRNFNDELNNSSKHSRSKEKNKFLNFSQIQFIKNPKVNLVSIMQKNIVPDSKLTLKRPPIYTSNEQREDIINEYMTLGWNVFTDIHANMSFCIPDVEIAVFPYKNTQIKLENGEYIDTGQKSYVDITKITFPYKPGDYVVHSFYGIAYFRDIVKRETAGSIRDYILLEYEGNDKLYVPIEQFERVTKYVGPMGVKPNLTKLGTKDWSRAMSKARKATRKMAFDLVDIYSRRAIAKGHSFSVDSENQRKMESDFEYIETDDQIRAIVDVKKDMESSRPMDRLICGDVGFGKTEVALRAAYKCVCDKMQVMLLCPTTILAQQHYTTFFNRLNVYGVNVEVLSRFKTPKESKIIADEFALGNIDILIGTHRLLSADINPKNLGLVIVDEEQRFGVAHKEKLKNFRDSVDVLTLSATPIPRTMQMATSGVRDMSLILSPPSNRQAVEVYVGQWDRDVISDAIRRELQRDGQVYYVSNKVKTIDDAAARVGLAAGEARIAVIHGKMNKTQIEKVMEEFSAKKFDVLVATTIIENGIDNPNTNTLIIENAQNLGLSQMYQLKGRVGRSVNKAFAYFLFDGNIPLKKEAVARLEAISEFSELGSGMRIAMRDLEIRGAGNFLGAEQSGNISHIGFDLFAQMLKNAIENAQNYGLSSKDESDKEYLGPSISRVAINIPGSAYLSSDIIQDIESRILWYRKFSCANSLEQVEDLEIQIKEDFDNLDEISNNFIWKSKIAALGLSAGFNIISIIGSNLVLEGKALSSYQIKQLRQIEGSYFAFKKRISIPLDRIIDNELKKYFPQIFDFLFNWDFK